MNDKPWALSFGELASFHLERCLGAYPVDFAASWTPPDYWDADDIALEVPEHPDIWIDGSREDFSPMGVLKLLVLALTSLLLRLLLITRFGARLKSMAMLSSSVAVLFYLSLGSCRLQRAEFWGAIVALQAYWPCHLGIDNLNVVRSIGRLLDADCLAKPLTWLLLSNT